MLCFARLGTLNCRLNRIDPRLIGLKLRRSLARCPLGFASGRFGFQSQLSGLKPHTRIIRALFFLFAVADMAFGSAIILNQRDLARAHIGAGTTLDTIKQTMLV